MTERGFTSHSADRNPAAAPSSDDMRTITCLRRSRVIRQWARRNSAHGGFTATERKVREGGRGAAEGPTADRREDPVSRGRQEDAPRRRAGIRASLRLSRHRRSRGSSGVLASSFSAFEAAPSAGRWSSSNSRCRNLYPLIFFVEDLHYSLHKFSDT